MNERDLKFNKTRAGVYKTLCPKHILAPNTNLANMFVLIDLKSLVYLNTKNPCMFKNFGRLNFGNGN